MSMMERMKDYPHEVTIDTDRLYDRLEELQGVADLLTALMVACKDGAMDNPWTALETLAGTTYDTTRGLYGLIEEAAKQKGANDER
ncbi:hypothetical protein [Hydrogenimonas urashimensis]|uniref:hypothetical protein n=1 Tax=Hydrogenimonas urashimensis TaxID=2740515 RepID=UPI001916521E|nr:hypothetical protein [Hydrogenimonas urashimensis]